MFTSYFKMLGLFCILSFIPAVLSVGCTNVPIGATTATLQDGITYDQLDNNTDSGYLAKSYKLDCCGLLTSFNVFIGATGTINLQVWRKQATSSTYDLVYTIQRQYEEAIFRTSTRYQYIDQSSNWDWPWLENVDCHWKKMMKLPGAVDQIDRMQTVNIDAPLHTMQVGDVIGWSTTNTEMVPYTTTGAAGLDNMRISPGQNSGSAFSTGSTISQRAYAINLVAGPNNPPKFTNLPFSKCFEDSYNVGSMTLYTLTYTDDDQDDVASLSVTLTAATPPFILDSGQVKVQQNYLDVGEYLLNYEVKDTCENTATSSLTICINNTAPTITNTVTEFTIREDDNVGKTVFQVTVTDKQGYMCPIQSVPDDNIFEMQGLTTTPTLVLLQNKAHPNVMDYDRTAQYTIVCKCTDDLGLSTNKTFIVNVQRNQECTYTDLPKTEEVSTKTKTTGAQVHQVACNDPETDPLTYKMSCDISNCPFELDQNTGVITVSGDLNALDPNNGDDARTKTITVTITTNDGHRDSVELLYLKLTDFNNKPTITEPSTTLSTVTVDENTAFEYQIEYSDSDILDSHTFDTTFFPTSCSDIYAIDNKGKITTKQNLDYEDVYINNNDMISCDVIVLVDDQREKSDPVRITLKITDVNEQQTGFKNSVCSITADEGQAGKQTVEKLGLEVVDPDLTDTQTFSMDCGTWQSYFKIDPSTQVITHKKEFDLDADRLEFTTATCDVTATDKAGHTISTTCTIRVEEINDNAPKLDKDKYDFTLTSDTPIGTSLGTCTSTDDDVKFEHTIHAYNARSGVAIITVPCTIKLSQDISGSAGQVLYDTLVATDTDNPQLTSTARICIIVTPPTTTVPVTTQANTNNNNNNNNNNNGGTGNSGNSGSPANFLEKPANLAWFIPAMIALAVMTALIGYMIYRCCRVPGFCSRLFSDMCGCFNNNKTGSGRITEVKKAKAAEEGRKNKASSEKSEPRGKGNKVDKPKPIHVPEKPNMPADNSWNIWTHTDLKTNTYLK